MPSSLASETKPRSPTIAMRSGSAAASLIDLATASERAFERAFRASQAAPMAAIRNSMTSSV